MPVTGRTGTDHIFPGVLAASVSRNDMVQGKLSSLLVAILAGILVAVEDLETSQLSCWTGAFN